MKVGRGRPAIMAILSIATLLSTSTVPALATLSPSRNLNLRLPGRSPKADLDRMQETGAVAWRIHGSSGEALRAARTLARNPQVPGPSFGIHSRLIVVIVRLGKRHPFGVLTNARTVGGLVGALSFGSRATVSTKPKEGAALYPHETVRVSTVREVRRTEVQEVPFQTLIQYSRDLAPGAVRVDRAGQFGRARRTFLITFRDGVRVSTELLSEDILAPAVAQIETHGAPTAGVEVGDATWYGCEGMHAAHKSLPFGTAVTVTNLDNGAAVTVTINDRGPYADGRIIDLCDGAFAQIAPLGQGVAHVKITW